MALIVPDVIIANTINLILDALRNDYNASVTNGQVERSMLSLLFDDLSLGKYIVLDNIVNLIVTTPENPRHIIAQLSYPSNVTQNTPSIYITLPGENERNNSVSIGEGDYPEYTFDNTPDGLADEYRKQFSRRFQTTYQIIIVSENKNEVVVLYNLLQCMIIASMNHFMLSGLENPSIGGQDVSLNNTITGGLFFRAITLNFEYEKVTPELVIQNIIRNIKLYWKPEGATVNQGPIEFGESDDVVGDSDS